MFFKDNRYIKLRIPAKVIGQIECIVNHFSTEVSWYGDVSTSGNVITIENVYLFPQVVTGGTFRTDTPQITQLYDEWYEKKLNEVADHYERTGESKPIMQYNGHSHVNMPISPSPTDITFRKSREGAINIYSIHNKKGEADWEIWTEDVVYEMGDIEVVYIDDVFADAEEFVQTPKAQAQTYRYGYYQGAKSYVQDTQPTKSEKKIKEESEEKAKEKEPSILLPTGVVNLSDMTEEEFQQFQDEAWIDQYMEQYGIGDYYGSSKSNVS